MRISDRRQGCARVFYSGFVVGVSAMAAQADRVAWLRADGGNGHEYEVIEVAGGISWRAARDAAWARGGHLATLTTAPEHGFAWALVSGRPDLWRAGDSGLIGPWLGARQLPASAEPSGGWVWITGEAFAYQAWATAQPDNSSATGVPEQFLCFGSAGGAPVGGWADAALRVDPLPVLASAFIVEYPTPALLDRMIVVPVTADAGLSEKAPDRNFGSDGIVRLTSYNSSWEGGGDGRGRGIVAFAPPGVPSSAILRADFEVFQSDGIVYPGRLVCEATFGVWSESLVTWVGQPAGGSVIGAGQNGPTNIVTLAGDPLTQAVRGWIDSPASLSGLLIRFEDEQFNGNPNGTRGDTLHTRESVADFAPALVVTLRRCPADLTGSSDPADPSYGVANGVLDASDFFYFLDQFVAGNERVCDYTGSANPFDPSWGQPNGIIDAEDFFYFLDLFVLTCD